MKYINDIFDNLDKWRNLPAYQLERRADIFFSIYLPEILFRKFGEKIDGVIPEFPIRVGTIHQSIESNKSFKADYLAKTIDSKTIILVELKTDDNSRRDKQDWYLERAKQVGMAELLDGVRKIYKATNSKKKYEYLLNKLQDMGFFTLDNGGEFQIRQANYDIHIVYIQPNNPDREENVISFYEVAEIIGNLGDELSLRFSKSLLRWANIKAGNS